MQARSPLSLNFIRLLGHSLRVENDSKQLDEIEAAKWRRIRQKIQPVTGHHILFILKRTLNYDGCVAITEGQPFDLTSLVGSVVRTAYHRHWHFP